jgi:hypothetical protein
MPNSGAKRLIMVKTLSSSSLGIYIRTMRIVQKAPSFYIIIIIIIIGYGFQSLGTYDVLKMLVCLKIVLLYGSIKCMQ